MNYVDLNSDLGESFGAYQMGQDEAIIPLISSANVACGYHAGDPLVMASTLAEIKKSSCQVGAHPGFYDLMGFGRRNLDVSNEEAKAYVIYQIGALNAFCQSVGLELQHVKLHGALYNMAAKNYSLSRAICEGIASVNPDVIILGLSGSETIRAAKEVGLRSALEVFADRAYEEDGSLVARTKNGAMIDDEDLAIHRVIRMIKEKKVEAITGKDIDIQADSICVHGDGKKALLFVEKIREALQRENISILSLKNMPHLQ